MFLWCTRAWAEHPRQRVETIECAEHYLILPPSLAPAVSLDFNQPRVFRRRFPEFYANISAGHFVVTAAAGHDYEFDRATSTVRISVDWGCVLFIASGSLSAENPPSWGAASSLRCSVVALCGMNTREIVDISSPCDMRCALGGQRHRW